MKNNRPLLRSVCKLAMILLCGITAGFLLLMAAYALPLAPIARNVALSAQAFDGSWETGEIRYEQLVKGYLTTQLDNSTDAAMLLAAARKSDEPLWRQAAQTAVYTAPGGPYAALIAYAQSGGETLGSASVARYWLGFLVYVKPLLLLGSYLDIRALQTVLQGLLLCAVLVGLCYRGLIRFTPAFALSLVCLTPAVTGFSLQFSTVYGVLLLSSLLILNLPRATETRFRTAVVFLLTGMVTNYIDYLTYPIASFGVPFVLYLLTRPSVSKQDGAVRFLMCLGAWLAGYFGMWAGKWGIALLLDGDPWFWANLVAKISERSSYAADGAALTYVEVLRSVFQVFQKKAYLLLAIGVTVGYGIAWLRVRFRRRSVGRPVPGDIGPASQRATQAGSVAGRSVGVDGHAVPAAVQSGRMPCGQGFALVCTALLPFLWYLLTSNHTYNHAFFTSRALVVTVFAVCALATYPLRSRRARSGDPAALSTDAANPRLPADLSGNATGEEGVMPFSQVRHGP